jgi:hypothetical protein
MSEPRRWKDSPDAPIGMRELLGSARPTRPLDEVTFRRNAKTIAKLPSQWKTAAPAAAAATISIWTKLAAAGAIGLAATGAVVAVELQEMRGHAPETHAAGPANVAPPAPTAPTAPTVVPTSSSVVAAAPSSTSTVLVKAAPSPPAIVHVPAPAASPAPQEAREAKAESPKKTSTLSAELLLLEDARAWASRDPQTALARLAEHRARHPAGLLSAERDLMELDLLRRTGRVQDARDRAKAWLARDPNGMHSARVREILASLDAAP